MFLTLKRQDRCSKVQQNKIFVSPYTPQDKIYTSKGGNMINIQKCFCLFVEQEQDKVLHAILGLFLVLMLQP